MFAFKTIVHATDFSPASDQAFQLACSLAREQNGRLIVLHVEQVPETVMGEFGLMPPTPIDVSQWQRKLDQLTPAAPITIERRLNKGDPATQILAVAAETKCDVIVLGAHGHTALHDLLMGSVTAEVMRRAPCSVITLKMPAAKSAKA